MAVSLCVFFVDPLPMLKYKVPFKLCCHQIFLDEISAISLAVAGVTNLSISSVFSNELRGNIEADPLK